VKILITGATGMLGRALVKNLAFQSHEILTPTRLELDLLIQDQVFNYLDSNEPDLIIHCAAQVGGIAANINDPAVFLMNNLSIDNNLLSAARKIKLRNLIYIASSCMYPKNYRQPLVETDVLKGALEETNEGYAIAKIAGTKTTVFVAEQEKLNWKVLVPSNLYGPGDSYDPAKSHLLAAIIRKVSEAKTKNTREIDVWGSGNARREFTFINDLADFIGANLEKTLSWPTMMNVGCGTDYSVNEFYEAAIMVAGAKLTLRNDLSKPEGMKQKLLDSSIARSLGWNPTTTLYEGISLSFEDFNKWSLNG
jgi:GDP-L-fucose synthase